MNQKGDILKRIYLDPSHPGSYGSSESLYKNAKKICNNISRNDVKSFLQSQDSYTLHGNVKKKYVKRPVLVNKPGHLLAADLADMGEELREINDNNRYILVLIDVYSRYVDAYTLKDKKGRTIASKLDHFFNVNYHSFKLLWTDEGLEFYNVHVSNVLSKHGVKLYHVFNRRFKSAYSERFIRTLKSKIYKMFTQLNTKKYIDILPKIIEGYNSSPHRGLIWKTPKEVHCMKDSQQLKKLEIAQYKQKLKYYGKCIKKENLKSGISSSRFLQPSTYVRLLIDRAEGVFVKSYRPIYTIEIFEIYKVVEGYPIIYYFKELQEEKNQRMYIP